MKVLHIVGTSGLYGTAHVILTLLEYLKKQNVDLHLATFGSTQLPTAAANIIDQANIYHGKEHDIINFNFINNLNCDIIHVHDYKSSVLVAIKKALRIIKTPTIRTVHGYTGTSKPWYNKIHLYQGIDKTSMGLHDCKVGVSEDMRHKFYFSMDHIVQNGIASFTLDNNISSEFEKSIKGRYVIGCIARLSKEKNIANLIKSMSKLSEHKERLLWANKQGRKGIALIIFGEGSERPYLEKLIDQLNFKPNTNIDCEVHLMGFDENAKRYFKYFDLYVQPSYTEGTPISVLEAMSTKTPLILTSVGGMKYLIEKDVANVCGTTSDDIANAIIHHNNTRHLHCRENAGYKLFLSQYTADIMAAKYLNIYKSLIQRK